MAVWRNTVYRDYAPFEGATGPAFHLARDGQRVERPIILEDHSKILQAARDFSGYPQVATSNDGVKYIARVLPHPYPGMYVDLSADNYGAPFVWCESLQRAEGLRVVGNDAVTGAPQYQHAVVRLIYTARTYRVLADGDSRMLFTPWSSEQENPLLGYPDEATLSRYVTRHPKPFFKTISVPRTLLRWVLRAGDTGHTGVDDAAAGPPLFESIGLPEPGVVREYTWHEVPLANLPETAISRAMGCLNKFPFDGHDAESLLCEAPDVVPAPHVRGDVVCDVRYRFRQVIKISRADGVTARGLNWFLRAVLRTAGVSPLLDYRLLTTTGISTGSKVFPTYDFAKLFRPE